MTDLIDVVQQSIDDDLVELFDITLPGYTSSDTNGNYYLFAGFDGETTKITFNSKTYTAIPAEISGIEISSSGAHSRPTLTVANIPVLAGAAQAKTVAGAEDSNTPGDIATLDEIRRDAVKSQDLSGNSDDIVIPFERNDELIGTKVVYHKTLKSKLLTGEEFPSQTFYIDRIASENNLFVVFELASPMDVEGAKIPARTVIGRYCPWQYQGVALGYGGGCTWGIDSNQHSFFREDDTKINVTVEVGTNYEGDWDEDDSTYVAGNYVKTTTNGRVEIWEAITSVPAGKDPRYNRQYWKRIDVCGKILNSCKIRFQGNAANTSLNLTVPLPFGGFPGSKKYR